MQRGMSGPSYRIPIEGTHVDQFGLLGRASNRTNGEKTPPSFPLTCRATHSHERGYCESQISHVQFILTAYEIGNWIRIVPERTARAAPQHPLDFL